MRAETPLLLRCHAGGRAFAVDAAQVKRIARSNEVEHGRVDGLEVFSLDGLLGLEPAETGPIIVLARLALAVTRVARPAPVEWNHLAALPPAARDARGCLAGVARIDGEMALVLDVDRLHADHRGSGLAWEMPAPRRWPAPAGSGLPRALFFMGPGSARKTMFALSQGQVVEAARELPFTRVRGANPCVAALADWRGHVVPVLDLEALLGVPGGAIDGADRYLIARAPVTGDLFVLPAGHCAAASLPLGEGAPVREVVAPMTPWVKAAYALDDGYFIVPDLDRLAAASDPV